MVKDKKNMKNTIESVNIYIFRHLKYFKKFIFLTRNNKIYK